MFKKMLDLQDKFNNGINPNWAEASYSFEHAIFVEAGEAGASLDEFKWWKLGVNDYQNYSVELIDIWHFHMSLGMKYFSKAYLTKKFESLWHEASLDEQTGELERGIRRYEYFMLKAEFEDFKFFDDATYILFKLFQEYNIEIQTPTDLYRNYLIKNCLNQVRKNNGYKEGTYIKLWDGVKEDNVFAWDIVSTISEEDLSYENILNTLQIEYLNITRKGEVQ